MYVFSYTASIGTSSKTNDKIIVYNEKNSDIHSRFCINLKSHRLFVKEISWKNKEYELLLFLVTNSDMVFDKETLYERVWIMDAVGNNATVAVHINRLREKIKDDPSGPHYIETVWGVGYRFRA
ncbi:MAG: response regulator transcription factor [Ruminococcus sp.]|nr:response regulator transcription factor [Ruminococcus sp.]